MADTILIDAKTLGKDGIGRYTRNLVHALTESDSGWEIVINTTNSGKEEFLELQTHLDESAHYSYAELQDKTKLINNLSPEIVQFSDYRSVFTRNNFTKYIVPIHDIFRFTRPELCYEDAYFVSNYGHQLYEEMLLIITQLSYVQEHMYLNTEQSERWRSSRHFQYYATLLFHTCLSADVILTATNTVKHQLEKYGLGFTRVEVIPYGINHVETMNTVKQVKSLDVSNYLVYVGQYRTHKKVQDLIKMFKHLQLERSDLELWLIGKDFTSNNLQLTENLKDIENVKLMGFIDDGDLSTIIANSIALVQPSIEEGYGFTPLEAFSLGVPVIYNKDNSTLLETLNGLGFKCDFNDTKAFLQCVTLAKQISHIERDALKYHISNLTWQNYAKRLLALYQSFS